MGSGCTEKAGLPVGITTKYITIRTFGLAEVGIAQTNSSSRRTSYIKDNQLHIFLLQLRKGNPSAYNQSKMLHKVWA